MKTLFILASIMIVLFLAAPNKADAQKRTTVRTLVGTITVFDCGDNCYLTITDSKGKEHVGLCAARPLCTKWNANTAMPNSYKGKRVTVTVGKGKQYNGAGQVMGTMDAFITIRLSTGTISVKRSTVEPDRSIFDKAKCKLTGDCLEEQTEPQNAFAGQLTIDQIIKMVGAKLPDDIIITQIQKTRTKFDLTPEELIKLKTAGVSDAVIRAMMK